MAYTCVNGELVVLPAEPGVATPSPKTSTVTLAIVGHFLSRAHTIRYRGAPKANSLVNRQRKAKGKPPSGRLCHLAYWVPKQEDGQANLGYFPHGPAACGHFEGDDALLQ